MRRFTITSTFRPTKSRMGKTNTSWQLHDAAHLPLHPDHGQADRADPYAEALQLRAVLGAQVRAMVEHLPVSSRLTSHRLAVKGWPVDTMQGTNLRRSSTRSLERSLCTGSSRRTASARCGPSTPSTINRAFPAGRAPPTRRKLVELLHLNSKRLGGRNVNSTRQS